jgi:hypothetical protein
MYLHPEQQQKQLDTKRATMVSHKQRNGLRKAQQEECHLQVRERGLEEASTVRK